MTDGYSPPMDLEESLDRPHRDTAAYRIGAQLHDHDARIRIMERDIAAIVECSKSMERRLDAHEKDQNNANMRLLLAVIGIVISATGGAVFMVFQLLTNGNHAA